jgi:hypothetical protein
MRKMAKAPFPDRNQNGYPDAFEAQEAQLLAQVSARRKAYMQRYGKAESSYSNTRPAPVNETNESYIAPAETNASEENVVKNLFK